MLIPMVCLAVAGFLPAKPHGVLIFTKTSAYRHASIPKAVDAVRQIAKNRGWVATATEDAAIFTDSGLERFDAVVFLNVSGNVLDPRQRKAFQGYIEGGGGFVGVHNAAGAETDWPFFGRLLGARFKSHPAIQQATIAVEDARHPSTEFLPRPWVRTDEWYDFEDSPRSRTHVLLSMVLDSYKGGVMKDHPIAWCHSLGKARSWYTALGHTEESYAEPEFRRHLAEGIQWALRR